MMMTAAGTVPAAKVLIVGTHIGSLAIPLSKHCKEITAIEANPNTFELLKINLQLNNTKNITPHNIFANDSHEKVEFLLNTVNSGGSKRKPKKNNFLYDYDADFVQCSVVLYGDFVWESTSFNFLSTGLSITFIHRMRAEGAIVAGRFHTRR